jgi:hypothetical protein
MAESAKILIKHNKLDHIIEVVHARIEDIGEDRI